jgi:hypothetical protein
VKVMPKFSVEDAQNRLGELFQMVSEGEEVFILGEKGRFFRFCRQAERKAFPRLEARRG